MIAPLAQISRSSLSQKLRNVALVLLVGTCFGTVPASAQDGTWFPDAIGSQTDWKNPENWDLEQVPTGIATFDGNPPTGVTSNVPTSVATIQFNIGAPAYSFTLTNATFGLTGSGILNSSANAPMFAISANGKLLFEGASTAGNATITANSAGIVSFVNTSTGGQARFVANTGGIFDISGLASAGMTAGSIEGAGTFQLGSKVLTVGNTLTTAVSGNIVDAGAFPGVGGGLTKVGTGTLTLSGVNTYTGATTVSGGSLRAGSATGLSSASAFIVNSVLDLQGFSNTVGSLAGSGNVTNSGGAPVTLTSGGDNTNTVFSGTMFNGAGILGLNKTGGGMLTLTGTNTYTGGTTVSAGTLQLGNISTTASIASTVVVNGGVFDIFNANTAGITTITINPGGFTQFVNSSTAGTAAILINSGGFMFFANSSSAGAATITTNAGGQTIFSNTSSGGQAQFITAFGGVVDISNLTSLGMTAGSIAGAGAYQLGSKALTVGSNTLSTMVSGNIVDGGLNGGTGGSLVKVGSGTITVSGQNTYSGPTTITAGTLLAGATTGFSLNSAFTVNSELDLNGFSNTVASLAGAGIVTNSGNAPVTLTSGGDNTSTLFTGTLANGVDTLGLTKTGTGTLTLTGAHTYSGGTTITAGVLQVDGALGSTAVTVQSGAILAGQGTIAGNVTIFDGGHLAPGPAAQTLGVGSLFLNPNSILDYQLSTPGVIGSGVNTLVNVTGNLTLDGVINVTNAVQFGSGAYRLLNYTGTLTDLTLALGTLPVGFDSTNVTVTTAVAHQVNLVVNVAGAPTQLWDGPNAAFDGTLHGGTGTWDNFTTNFKDAAVTANQSWQNGVAVFAAEPGTVTLGADIFFQGMQFESDGYTIEGAGAFALHPTGTAMISTDPGVTATIAAPIVGTGGLNKTGQGSLILTGDNSYSGGTTISGGALSVANDTNLGDPGGGLTLDGGELATTGSGFVTLRPVLITANNGILAAAAGGVADFQGNITGSGSLTIGDGVNTGIVKLSGTNTYTAATTISAGTLQVDGVLGNTPVTVQSGATLTGQGTIAGSVTILDGGHLAAGSGAQTLGVGSLFLNPNSILDYRLSTPGVIGSGINTLVNVTGNLTLDGVLNVTNGGQFGSGAYRLLNYTGTLTDLTLDLGTLPVGFDSTNVTVTIAVAHQVNLVVNAAGAPAQFWDGPNTVSDGTFHGGTGTWDNFTTNFTHVAITANQSWQNGFALFAGAPGTVTLGADILFQGIQFISDGYTIVGAGAFALHPTGTAVIRTDPSMTAIIAAPIAGPGGLNKKDQGLLIFTGDNSYSGGTMISGGALRVASDTNLGDPIGGLTLNGGELETSANFSSPRTVALVTGNGANILAAAASTTASYTGLISGAGGLTVGDANNLGTIVLSNVNNSYTGGTTITGAILNLADDRSLGDLSGGLTLDGGEFLVGNGFSSLRAVALTANGGTLAAPATGSATFVGNITGGGSLTIGDMVNTGSVELGGISTYLGNTTIVGGTTLLAGSAGALSPTSGFIVNGTLDLNGFPSQVGSLAGSGTVTSGNRGAVVLTAGNGALTTFRGVLQDGAHSLGLTKVGSGTLTLTGVNTYTGDTTVSAGTLRARSATAFSPNSAFTVNSVLDLNGFSNTIGSLAGSGTVTISVGPGPAGSFAELSFPTVNPATLTAGGNGSDTLFSGTIIDGVSSLGLTKTGAGTLTLTGTNSYSGNTTITAGTLRIGNGGGSGSIEGRVINNGALVVNRSGSLLLAGVISGTGSLSQVGPGTLILTGSSIYTGPTTVSAGALQVDGVLGNTAVSVQSGASLTGQGTIGGSVTILDGGHLAPGPEAQTLTVGSLALNVNSILDNRLGTPGVIGSGVNSLVSVGGNLTLGGILNVADEGSFGPGSYRLLNYNGTLSDLTLALGTLPVGFSSANVTVTTAVAKQVNLIVSASGKPTLFWDGSNNSFDGTVHGGTGTWENFTTNFTDGVAAPNQSWQNAFAIFSAASGTVTLGADILFQGMQFSIDGYTVVGAGSFALHPTGTAILITDTDVRATIAAPIVGTGGLNKAGPGLLTLTGANTYSGGTTISGGILSVASDTNLGIPTGGLVLEGGELLTTANAFSTARAVDVGKGEGNDTLAAATGTMATYTGVISSGGNTLTVGDGTNAGTVVLTENNTYSGGTNIFPGTLVAVSDNALGTGPAQLFNGMLMILPGVTLPNQVNFLAGGVLDNTGTLNNNVLNASTMAAKVINSGTINGNVTLGGPGDTVQLFTGSQITGNLALRGTTNSTLILDGAGQQLLSLAVIGTLTNNGTLVKQGIGTWTIDRALDAPLGTDILAGTLAVSAVLTSPQVNITAGATLQLNAGGSVGNLVVDGSLVFASTGTVNFSGVISGPGNVIQNGPGTTVLSGRNTYTGGTTIDLGTLLVNNPQALGTGNVTVNGGVLGADPQPINVLGNYTQNAGGTLQLNIAGRSPGQFDVLNVTGNAALNGTLRLVNQGYQPQNGDTLQLIITGGVLTGRLTGFQNPFAPTADFNTIDLVYARQSVTLEFLDLKGPPAVVTTTDFSSFAFTANQRAAANLLDAVQLNPKAAKLISFLDKEPFANLPRDFNRISPDGLTAFYEIGFSNANIQRLNLEGRFDDLRNGSNGFSSNMKVNGASVDLEDRGDADGKSSKAVMEPILQHGPDNRWGVWMTGFGDFVSVDADANAKGYDFTTGGASLGIDYRLTGQLAIGVMGEYSHTWTHLNQGGHIDVDSGRGGVYGTWFNRGIYLNGAIYGGHNNCDSGRAGLDGLANGGGEGAEWSAFISGGYDFHFGPLTVGPITSLQYTDVHIDGFDEKGSLAPLQIHSDSLESLRSDIGFRAFCQWQIGKIVLEPSLKATWEHEYKYSALPISAGFAGIPGASGTFFGPSEGHDSAVVSAGVSAQWTPAISTYVNYDGQLGRGNYDSNAITGGVRISF